MFIVLLGVAALLLVSPIYLFDFFFREALESEEEKKSLCKSIFPFGLAFALSRVGQS